MSRFARICISKLILVYCIVRSISAYFCFTNKFLVINIKYFKNFIIMIKFKVYDKEDLMRGRVILLISILSIFLVGCSFNKKMK